MPDSNSVDNEKEVEQVYDLSSFRGVFAMLKDGVSDDKIKSLVSDYINEIISDAGLSDKYETVFLYDNVTSISSFHSDRIYTPLSFLNKQKDIHLILQSGGGKIEPAYLISRICKRLSKNKFVISIPRQAKSAATLISLGADELHLGLLSELGPIDPQFSGFPASGLSNAMEKIAKMSEEFPSSSDMFAKYLIDKLDIRHLAYYERINESAAQYAERLLKRKKLPKGWDETSLANHFTNHYKDHGFVIDSDEAKSLLGSSIVKENTDEYNLTNKIYDLINLLEVAYDIFRDKDIRYVGSIEYGLQVLDKPEK